MTPVPLSYINFINISRKKLRYQHKIAPPNYYCRRAGGNMSGSVSDLLVLQTPFYDKKSSNPALLIFVTLVTKS